MNVAAALATLVVDALTAAGVGDVVLCPGSRSAPLAYDLTRRSPSGSGVASGAGSGAGSGAPALHVRHDERVAAFTALGVGKRGDGSLAAVVTTSGTAAANLHPAVLEAHHANVPLIVVTADRPPELRGTWANQTSELQAALFGDAVRFVLDLSDVRAADDPDAARALLAEALTAARGGPATRPGPVHLNLGFGEPLVPADPPPPEDPPLLTGDSVGDRGAR